MKNSITYYAAWKNVFLAVALLSFLGHSTQLKAQTDVPEQIQINCGGPAYAYDGTTSWEIKGNQFLFREGADQMAIETGAPNPRDLPDVENAAEDVRLIRSFDGQAFGRRDLLVAP